MQAPEGEMRWALYVTISPDLDDLHRQQAVETDVSKREGYAEVRLKKP